MYVYVYVYVACAEKKPGLGVCFVIIRESFLTQVIMLIDCRVMMTKVHLT
jgi:hypothetical protein